MSNCKASWPVRVHKAPEDRTIKDRVMTPKQQAFVDAYKGNATEAATLAGYKSPKAEGCRLMKNPLVVQAILAREKTEKRPYIASRLDRQKFWTDVMKDEDAPLRERLKAAELLGKSEADFTDKVLMGSLEQELKNMPDDQIERELSRLSGDPGVLQ